MTKLIITIMLAIAAYGIYAEAICNPGQETCVVFNSAEHVPVGYKS